MRNIKPQRLLVAMVIVLVSQLTAAQTAIDPCENITHSLPVLACAKSGWKTARGQMDESLDLLRKRINKTYAADPDLGAQLLEDVEHAQRYWAESVKADCDLEAFEIEEGTQAYRAAFFSCSTRRYEQRASYLNSLLAF